MKSLNNLGLLVKIVIPLTLTALVAAGLVAYARSSMNEIAAQTQAIVDVQTARQGHVLNLQIGITEATVQNRNILLEMDASKMAGFHAKQEAAIQSATEAQARLAKLADTPERVAANDRLRAAVNTYFAVLARATEAGLRNDGKTGIRIAQEEASPCARNCASRSRSGSPRSIRN